MRGLSALYVERPRLVPAHVITSTNVIFHHTHSTSELYVQKLVSIDPSGIIVHRRILRGVNNLIHIACRGHIDHLNKIHPCGHSSLPVSRTFQEVMLVCWYEHLFCRDQSLQSQTAHTHVHNKNEDAKDVCSFYQLTES